MSTTNYRWERLQDGPQLFSEIWQPWNGEQRRLALVTTLLSAVVPVRCHLKGATVPVRIEKALANFPPHRVKLKIEAGQIFASKFRVSEEHGRPFYEIVKLDCHNTEFDLNAARAYASRNLLPRGGEQPEEPVRAAAAAQPASIVERLAEWIFARYGTRNTFEQLRDAVLRDPEITGFNGADFLTADHLVYETKPHRPPLTGWPLRSPYKERIEQGIVAEKSF
jgi:hypothetical protein